MQCDLKATMLNVEKSDIILFIEKRERNNALHENIVNGLYYSLHYDFGISVPKGALRVNCSDTLGFTHV